MAASSSLVTAPTEEPVEGTVAVAGPIDLRLTLAPLVRGRGDPTTRFARGTFQRASRTPEGPAAEVISLTPEGVRVQAWGPGAGWLVAAMPDLVGLDDDPSILVPHHRLVAEISRRLAGLRLGRTDAILEALVPAVLEQKVTGAQAQRGFAGLVRALGEPAPGPLGLRLPPAPSALATLPYYGYHPLGIERRRAETVRRVAREADRLEALAGLPAPAVQAALMALPGIGPWSAAEVAAYCGRLRTILEGGGAIRLVQVYTVARPPAEPWVGPLTDAQVEALGKLQRDFDYMAMFAYRDQIKDRWNKEVLGG